jgi:hypothetical protein
MSSAVRKFLGKSSKNLAKNKWGLVLLLFLKQNGTPENNKKPDQ